MRPFFNTFNPVIALHYVQNYYTNCITLVANLKATDV